MSLSIAALTRLPPELAHKTALGVASRLPSFALGALARANVVKDPCLEVEAFGLTFPTPLNDCLLYTSPSPRDRTRSRMPSSA